MIYFDNAATTFPKPDVVLEKTFDFAKNHCANPGRSAHNMSVISSRAVYECREAICELINGDDISNVAFTKNCTEALNIGLFSALDDGDDVISSVLEHNSIIRVLEHLKKTKNITVTYLRPNQDMEIRAEDVRANIKKNTKLIALCHANNLVGTVNEIEEIGKIARDNNILFLLDAAQSIGKIDIDVKKMNIDILCAPGHKALFGLSGTGFIYAGKNIKLSPILYGGTGSFSDEINEVEIMPDKLETGTVNVVGIKSMLEGIKFIKNEGIDTIFEKENEMTKYFIQRLSTVRDVIIYTPNNNMLSSIVSFNIKNRDSSLICSILNYKYNIAVRGGLHCNPFGHEFLNTLETGFVRASLSYFNTKEEIDYFTNSLNILD